MNTGNRKAACFAMAVAGWVMWGGLPASGGPVNQWAFDDGAGTSYALAFDALAPEPATLMLTFLGLAGAGLAARRRRKHVH